MTDPSQRARLNGLLGKVAIANAKLAYHSFGELYTGEAWKALAKNLADVAEVWRRGSVVASWLLDLTAISLLEQPSLERFSGRVSDSGEGRWTILAAIESTAPAPVRTASLFQRFVSRGEDEFAAKLLSAIHLEKAAAPNKPAMIGK